MMKQLKHILMVVLLMACEERIEVLVPSKNLDKLVVEGLLTSENLNHRIKLSHTYLNLNDSSAAVSGAVVNLSDGNNTYTLTESPAGSGLYYTPLLKAVTGKTYTLTILSQGGTYIAQDSPVAVESFGDTLQYHPEPEGYRLDVNPSGQDPNYINYNLSWENTSACVSGAACDGRIVFYDLKTIDVNDLFKPSKEDFYFPPGTTIIRKKYSVSPAYQTFLRAVMSETEWRGGVFDVLRADVPTNVSGGAVGFFAVSTVVSDTTVVK